MSEKFKRHRYIAKKAALLTDRDTVILNRQYCFLKDSTLSRALIAEGKHLMTHLRISSEEKSRIRAEREKPGLM
jgi:hypothetical protein